MKLGLKSVTLAAVVMSLALVEPALAQEAGGAAGAAGSTAQSFSISSNGISAGDIATNIADSGKGFAKLAEVASFVIGLFLMLVGILKFNAYKNNPQQTPLSTPITLVAVAVALIAVPSIVGSGLQTMFGGEAATVEPW